MEWPSIFIRPLKAEIKTLITQHEFDFSVACEMFDLHSFSFNGVTACRNKLDIPGRYSSRPSSRILV